MNGTLDLLEAFAGGTSGDLGRRLFRVRQNQSNIFGKTFTETLNLYKDVPIGATYEQLFHYQHEPSNSFSVTRTGVSECSSGSDGQIDPCTTGDEDPTPNGEGDGGLDKALPDGCPGESPIVIDLASDGFSFGGPENPVLFDILGNDEPMLLQWVKPGTDDAFLFADYNGNGVVDDGAELFGTGTVMHLGDWAYAPNGFVGLSQYDQALLGGNNDGFISEADRLWSHLFLWLDEDADGKCHPWEVRPLADLGIFSLDVIPVQRDWIDEHGNHLPFWAKAYSRNQHHPYIMVDVFFKAIE